LIQKLFLQEATSHMNLGAMLHVNGKLTEAEQSYLEALRLKPDDHITRMNLQKLRHLLMKKGIVSSSSHSSPPQWMMRFDDEDT
jgi:predicted TPR repeat methyltransferase